MSTKRVPDSIKVQSLILPFLKLGHSVCAFWEYKIEKSISYKKKKLVKNRISVTIDCTVQYIGILSSVNDVS